MTDQISLNRLQFLHPLLKDEAIQIYSTFQEKEFTVRITQTLRTWQQQSDLYEQGRSKPGKIVTRSKPGLSFHQYGLALDFCLIKPDKTVTWDLNTDLDCDHIPDWMEVVFAFKAKGWTWGGDFVSFKDYPHLQKTFGLSVRQCIALSQSGKIDYIPINS